MWSLMSVLSIRLLLLCSYKSYGRIVPVQAIRAFSGVIHPPILNLDTNGVSCQIHISATLPWVGPCQYFCCMVTRAGMAF